MRLEIEIRGRILALQARFLEIQDLNNAFFTDEVHRDYLRGLPDYEELEKQVFEDEEELERLDREINALLWCIGAIELPEIHAPSLGIELSESEMGAAFGPFSEF